MTLFLCYIIMLLKSPRKGHGTVIKKNDKKYKHQHKWQRQHERELPFPVELIELGPFANQGH